MSESEVGTPVPGAGRARDARLPVIVVSGFLGSGKTTLLKRVLATPELANTLLIVNEIGEIGIDHHLLERSDDQTVLLDNGCMCCQLRTDLQALLVDLSMRLRRGELPSFERIVIETSGLADPGPVAQTLYSDGPLARDYRLAHVVTLVDATQPGARAAAPLIAERQVAAADLIVVSKADRAAPEQCAHARQWARGINAHARCETEAMGDLDITLLLAPTPFGRLGAWADPEEAEEGAGGSYLGRHISPHPASVASFALTFDEPVPQPLFRLFLDVLTSLRGPDLLRTKGILYFDDAAAPVLIQGVCHIFDKPVTLAPGASAPAQSSLVFIARAITRDDIEALWRALQQLSR